MNRLLANRGILLGAIVVCATGLVGAAGLLSRPDTSTPPPVAAKPGAPASTVTKQQPAQDPRCAFQDKDDKDDDAKESKVKTNKPDLDDDELECGDQNDDDREVGEKDREHGEHNKKAPAKKADEGKTAKTAAGGK